MPNNQKVTRRDAIARLAALLAGGTSIAALGTAIEGLGSPGPTSPGFANAYIKKHPTIDDNLIRPIGNLPNLRLVAGDNSGHNPTLRIEDDLDPVQPGFVINLGSDGNYNPQLQMVLGASTIIAALMALDTTNASFSTTLQPVSWQRGPPERLTLGSVSGGLVGVQTEFSSDPLASGGGFRVDTNADINFLSAGAQVGLTTGIGGAQPAGMSLGNHRHAFSGRFYVGGFLQTSVLAGNPLKFARFKIANNFTVRRISVYALTAPVGNGETWGIVNAAGATQGTAVALNGGVQENEAAQTTNLTGGTAYYLAQIGVAATTPSANVNVEVEYTANS